MEQHVQVLWTQSSKEKKASDVVLLISWSLLWFFQCKGNSLGAIYSTTNGQLYVLLLQSWIRLWLLQKGHFLNTGLTLIGTFSGSIYFISVMSGTSVLDVQHSTLPVIVSWDSFFLTLCRLCLILILIATKFTRLKIEYKIEKKDTEFILGQRVTISPN